jgi:outer membrane receptor for ferrienterochelin and colicin
VFRQRLLATILMVAAASSPGCGASHGVASEESTTPSAGRRNAATITAEDIRKLDVSNLYDVVQRLHPEWLTARNAGASARGSSANEVQVYIDNQRAGATDVLRQLTANSAVSLHHFSPSEAQGRFGNGNLNGVIQVVMVANR